MALKAQVDKVLLCLAVFARRKLCSLSLCGNQGFFSLTKDMAAGGHYLRSKSVEENLSCPVCLEILENPISIPCGHT